MSNQIELEFESERLRFRPLVVEDLDLAIEQWTDPEVTKYAGGKTYTKKELIAEMPNVVRRCAGGCIGVWCLTDKATNEKVGTAILLPMPVEEDDTNWDLVTGDEIPEGDIEIGYILKQAAWGSGYATEACTRLLQFAFEDSPLKIVVASIDAKNKASERVLLKSGLVPQGIIYSYGAMCPGFRITKSEWMENQMRDV